MNNEFNIKAFVDEYLEIIINMKDNALANTYKLNVIAKNKILVTNSPNIVLLK